MTANNEPKKMRVHALQLTRMGDDVGVLLPRALLAKLNIKAGDLLYFTESPDGLRVTKHTPEVTDQLTLANEVMKHRREALRRMASS